MTTKFLIKSILAVNLVLIMSSTASAYVYKMIGSQLVNCTLSPLCSISVEGGLKGLTGNPNSTTFFEVTLAVQEGTMVFYNPGGQGGGIGVPFGNVFTQITISDFIDASQVEKSGKAVSEVIFHDDEMIDGIVDALQDQCLAGNLAACATLEEINTKENWLRFIVVTRYQVLGKQITNGFLEDALGSQCEAPNSVKANPINFVGVAFNYGCTEECHNKTGTPCPNSLPLP